MLFILELSNIHDILLIGDYTKGYNTCYYMPILDIVNFSLLIYCYYISSFLYFILNKDIPKFNH